MEFKSERVNELHRSCLGNIHLIGRKNSFEISLSKNKITLLSKYPSAQFEKWIQPCVTASSNFVYNQKYALKNQLLSYMIISKKENKITALIKIIDELNLSRSKDDFVLQKAMNIRIHSSQVDAWNTLMYPPLFAPLVNMGSELCLFNHTMGYLEFFSFEGKTKRFVPITYHEDKKWQKQILVDKATNKVYTVFKTKTGKAIYEINTQDGTIHSVLFFDCSFVEKMTIHRGYLFYLESGVTNDLRNRVLHRVKIQ
ncbi:MAG TPA: hypothetical protein ENJ53_08605 [Phaeodactylibacter sp.]|nr:hypothetical protein [Phaeodactylibacter sp.]